MHRRIERAILDTSTLFVGFVGMAALVLAAPSIVWVIWAVAVSFIVLTRLGLHTYQ